MEQYDHKDTYRGISHLPVMDPTDKYVQHKTAATKDVDTPAYGAQAVAAEFPGSGANSETLHGDKYAPLSMSDFPLLPSQLLHSYDLTRAPVQLFAETRPEAGQFASNSKTDTWTDPGLQPTGRDPCFAEIANDMINKSLGRTPGGTSVVEPNSVLDESGRLYHGYKEGKYLLPNDAVL